MLKQKATFLSLCIFDISKHLVQQWLNAVNDKLLEQPLTNHSSPFCPCWLSINGYFENIIRNY